MESEANLGGGAPQSAEAPVSAPAPSAPAVPDSASSIMSDLRQAFNPPEPAPPAAAPAVPVQEFGVQPDVAAPPPVVTPDAPPAPPVEGAASIAAVPPDVEPPAPESHLAPLFSLAMLPAAESIPQAVELVRNLEAYDPHTHKLLANSVFQAMPETFRDWVLGDMGVKPEQVDQFVGWLKNGGPQAPTIGAFPEPEKDGEFAGWVTLQNGVQIDTSTPEGLERYDNLKFRHDYELEKQQSSATARAAEEKVQADAEATRAQQEYRQAEERVTAYVDARYAVRDQMIEEVVAPLAEEDKIFGQMFRAYVKDHIDGHPELKRIGEEAAPHVLAADGRVSEFARRQESVIRREINTLKQDFSRHILRLNRAEIAATATAPKLPPGTRTVESFAAPLPGENEPVTFADVQRQAREFDRQQAGGANR